ncbi:MAG: hypothetical protein S4CHLAM6_05880 [Chlamydiae bacterium]|nr:hypothetical protein [Chlamydiota bacterium]
MRVNNIGHVVIQKHTKEAPQKSKSWWGFFTKTGLSLTALGVVSQLIYNRQFSPSSTSYSIDTSPYKALLNQSEVDCDSSAFKAVETFFNIFENSGSLYMNLGLSMSEPPGSLQAFAVDQYTEAFECAFDSYQDDKITTAMKNKLLGRILGHIRVNHRSLVPSAQKLIAKGANPNHQEKMSYRDSKGFEETTFSPLMTAYKNLDAEFYDYLIEHGASPGMQIHFKNKAPQTIIESIIDDMISNPPINEGAQKRLHEAYLCPIYRKIIDASIGSLINSKGSFSDDEKTELRVKTYMEIQPHICKQFFECSEKEADEYEVKKLKDAYLNKMGATQNLFEDFKGAFKNSEYYTEAEKEFAKPFEEDSEIIVTQKESSGIIGEAFNSVYETAQEAWDAEIMRKTRGVVADMGAGAIDTVKGGVDLISDRALKATSIASDVLQSERLARIGSTAKDLAESGADLAIGAVKGGVGLVGSAAESIASGASRAYNSEVVKNIGSSAKNLVEEGGSFAVNTAKSGASLAGNVVGAVATGASDAYHSEIVKATGEAVKDLAKGGASLTVGAAKRGASLAGDVVEAVASGASQAYHSEIVKATGEAVKDLAEGGASLTVGAAKRGASLAGDAVEAVASGASSVYHSEALEAVSGAASGGATLVADGMAGTAELTGSAAGAFAEGLSKTKDVVVEATLGTIEIAQEIITGTDSTEVSK